MSRLPVIVGFGGYNSAGRSSFHHGFRRTVIESLPTDTRQETLAGLAVMMKLVSFSDGAFRTQEGEVLTLNAIEQRFGTQILEGTLIRRIEKRHLDVDAAYWQKNVKIGDESSEFSFVTTPKQLPEPVPTSWQVLPLEDGQVRVVLTGACDVRVDSYRSLPVKSAGQLPTGFEPGELYNSRFHPRGLQMSIVGVADALHSTGLAWEDITRRVAPDEVAVYAGSVMSQVDEFSYAGLMQARLKGGRVTAKQLPLSLNTMPADFINAYVIGSVGATGSVTGACATFLYNLQRGIDAITQGQARVVIVGNSEAPITQECIDGYGNMSALATEDGLRNIEGKDDVDFRRASRPFGANCGFTLAESCQFVVLMDDELAIELGADIHGATPDVFVNADGFKKSISAPGPGNYLTVAKAVAAAAQIVGLEGVRERSFIHAHGSSTPANRVTESEILDRVADVFGIHDWPVAAVKAYVGHSLAPASGDQLISALGSFKYGIIPGIKTIDQVADDVHQKNLRISTTDQYAAAEALDVCFLNSKGFGGNNASAYVLAPHVVERMLVKRYGQARFNDYLERREQTRAKASEYDQRATQGQFDVIYNFGQDMIDESQIHIDQHGIQIPGFEQLLTYRQDTRFTDMLD